MLALCWGLVGFRVLGLLDLSPIRDVWLVCFSN